MATIETLLIRRSEKNSRGDGIGPDWRKLKVPTKYLFDPKVSQYLSRDLDVEVATCLVQTASSVLIFYRYKRGKLLRKIEIDEGSFSAEGFEEAWEKNLFENGEEHPSVGGSAIRALESELGLKSISQVPEIKIDYKLPTSIPSSSFSWIRIFKIVFYVWVGILFLVGTLIAIFHE